MALTITKRLRKHAITAWKASEDSTNAELQKLYGKKLFASAITAEDIVAINNGTFNHSSGGGKKKKKDDDHDPKKKVKKKSSPAPKKKEPATVDDDDDDDEPSLSVVKAVREELRKSGLVGRPGDVNPEQAFTKNTKIRVKEAAENYETTKKEACYPAHVKGTNRPHPLAGLPARCGEVTLDHPSDRDKAVALAFTKWSANRNNDTGRPLDPWLKMTDHDREMLLYAAHNEKWVGLMTDGMDSLNVVKRRKLNDLQIKTMLDDSVSGGIEITPVVFDDALILTPVLYGEFFPFVNLITVAKGRRVKGGSMANPPFTSGIAEGTAIQPFSTSAFVGAFDTPIYAAVSAVELGQDFEEDSPVDLGGQLVEQFGLKALEYLDRVITVGNGFNEAQGFFNATAATLINSTFGAGGPIQVSDLEALEFGVGKEYRTEAGAFMAFASNDYTYRKVRAVKVAEGDQRRVFGLDQQSYQVLGYPYKVSNFIADGYMAFLNLRRYRMYRRLGMQVRVETGGRQLALNNTRLIVVRMRYGGQLDKGQAAAIIKDASVM